MVCLQKIDVTTIPQELVMHLKTLVKMPL